VHSRWSVHKENAAVFGDHASHRKLGRIYDGIEMLVCDMISEIDELVEL